jgi:hypothetical protein
MGGQFIKERKKVGAIAPTFIFWGEISQNTKIHPSSFILHH